MKNRIIALLLTLVMLVGMVGVFASCGEEEPEAQEPCTTHTDKNGDGKCDTCQATVEKPKDPTTDDPTDDPTEEDPTEEDPTEDDPTTDDPTEDDPTEEDPTEEDPTTEDPTEEDPTEDPTEDTPKPPLTDFCDHYDDNYDGYCDECDTQLEAEHECDDGDGDGECDECGVVLDEDKVVSYPWNKQTLIFQFTENDNGKELSSGCHRYLAGDDTSFNETIDKSIKKRNTEAEYLTKIKVTYTYWPNTADYGWGDCIEKIENIVDSQSTGNVPDVYCNFVYDMVGASVKGCFANLRGTSRGAGELKGLNYFEFLEDDYNESINNRGYMYEYMTSVTLSKHKMYILASDYFTDMIRAFFIIPVGIQMLEAYGEPITGDKNGDGKFTVDDFYKDVTEGNWDYQMMMDYAAAVYQDDGNPNTSGEWLGDKRIGFAMGGGLASSGLMYTTSVVIIHNEWNPDRNEYDYYYPEENEALYDFCAATTKLFQSPGIMIVKNENGEKSIDRWGASHLLAIRTRFAEGAVLFGDIMMVGALEYDEYQSMSDKGGFGVVPVPLYSGRDSGDRYLTQIHNVGRPGAIGVNTTKFVECTAFLNYQSTHSTDILNDYYNYKLMYDIAGGAQGTVEMLRYIRLNVRTSFDKAFEDAIGVFYGQEAYDRKILVIFSGKGFEGDMRQEYAALYDVKSANLKTLVEYYETAEE